VRQLPWLRSSDCLIVVQCIVVKRGAGELILWIARGVGFLVAIVAILLCFMIMMIARTLISLLLYRCGVFGVVAFTSAAVWSAMKIRNVSFKTIWAILSSSCS
jgi:hypothetical protein